jgi:hypothetical protein
VPTEAHTDFLAGLDLGQSADYSVLAVVQRTWPARTGGPKDREGCGYAVRHLRRWPLKTSYQVIVADVGQLLARPPLSWPLLAVDQTGVGAAVVDTLRAARIPAVLRPICITGGTTTAYGLDNATHVPKKELVGVLQILLQNRRLKIAPMPERAALVEELDNFRVKITAAANETFESWRERDHDDMVLAVALACWLGESMGVFHAPSGSIPNPSSRAILDPRQAVESGRSQGWRINPRYRRRPG